MRLKTAGNIFCGAVLLLFFATPLLSRTAADEPRHEFLRKKDGYTFTGTFFIRGKTDCVINMLYDYNHFREMMSHVRDMERLRQGRDWYDVAYTYSIIFYENRPVIRRRIYPEAGMIRYELLSLTQKGIVTPDIRSMQGYYRVTPEKDGCRVEFFQEGLLGSGGAISGFFVKVAGDQAAKFLKRMQQYMQKNCENARK